MFVLGDGDGCVVQVGACDGLVSSALCVNELFEFATDVFVVVCDERVVFWVAGWVASSLLVCHSYCTVVTTYKYGLLVA